MRIAALATTRNPLVEPFAGGQESMTATLAAGLRARGHHVRLYAQPGTDPGIADEVVTYEEPPPFSPTALADPQLPEPAFLSDQQALLGALTDIGRRRDVDVIHNQSLSYLPPALARMLPAPVLTTLHTPPFPWLELGAHLGGAHAHQVAVSHALAAQWSTLDPPPPVIHNGVDPLRFRAGPGGPDVAWVGRMVPEKGPGLAIRAAVRGDFGLRLAGPVEDRAWFGRNVEPHLTDRIRYVGHLSGGAVADLTGHSAALLMTPRWDEPFGQVTVEAALTGTPVVAVARGGLQEVVDRDIGLLVADTGDDAVLADRLAAAVGVARTLPRDRVREVAERRFSSDRMAREYEDLFGRLIRSGGIH